MALKNILFQKDSAERISYYILFLSHSGHNVIILRENSDLFNERKNISFLFFTCTPNTHT